MRVGLFVAHYKEYYESFVDHLVEVKLFHSDMEVRKLTSATLGILVPIRPDYFINVILGNLVKKVTNGNLFIRHGSVLGIGEILLGLSGLSSKNNCMVNSMKNSIFLKSMAINEKKLINAGEYMIAFLNKYDELKIKNN